MSSPFPLEDATVRQGNGLPMFDPWHEQPKPDWSAGLLAEDENSPLHLGVLGQILSGAGSFAAKGEALFAHPAQWLMNASAAQAASEAQMAGASTADVAGMTSDRDSVRQAIEADARERVKAMTPDAATTGTAAQVVHSLAEGATGIAMGTALGGAPAAVALMGGAEGLGKYQEAREQGITPGTAAAEAAVTGVASAAGVVMPMGFGSGLLTKLLTGAATNLGFGMVNRYADHAILEAGGYHEMAQQQKTFDGVQMLTDALLGTAFGGLAHVHGLSEKLHTAGETPGAQDAALTANLALRDRALSPGVAVDPQAAGAHQVALEKAVGDLLQGRPVDVSQTGLDQATFLKRPEAPTGDVQQIFTDAIKESGVAEHHVNLQRLEDMLAGRMQEKVQREEVPPSEPPMTLYHGSNATFDQFDKDFIGSGEGAQSYGHGIYLAENKDVAQSYAFARSNDRLSQQDLAAYYAPGRKIAPYGTTQEIDQVIAHHPESHEVTVMRTDPRGLIDPYETTYGTSGADWMKVRKVLGQPLRTTGNLYDVAVGREHAAKMMDWDKPVSEQPAVAKVFEQLAPEMASDWKAAGTWQYAKAGALYKGVADTLSDNRAEGQRRVSEALHAVGVPGIRYLDAGSRGVGEGSRNMVIFDEKLAELTHRNGDLIMKARPFAPDEGELKAAGLETPRDAIETSLIAHAMSIDPDRVEALSKQHSLDDAAFVKAVTDFLHEHDQNAETAAGGQGRGGESAATTAAGGERPAGGSGAAQAESIPAPIRQALAERPDLAITDENGAPVRAADELARVIDDNQRQAAEFQTAVTAATDCFGRHGT